MKNLFSMFLVVIANWVFVPSSVLADQKEREVAKIERIGGTFKVSKISKLKDGGFNVEFDATEGNPRFARLFLESSHVHVAVAEGAVIRLSADVIDVDGKSAEVAQVVIFLPGKVGRTPVWLLSKKQRLLPPPSKLLEMHAPSTDYQVM